MTLLGVWNAQKIFDAARSRALDVGSPFPGADRFGYMALLGVGRTEEEGHRACTRSRATSAPPRSSGRPS